jgi:hypothetical protein
MLMDRVGGSASRQAPLPPSSDHAAPSIPPGGASIGPGHVRSHLYMVSSQSAFRPASVQEIAGQSSGTCQAHPTRRHQD